jgi:hypothetical protein
MAAPVGCPTSLNTMTSQQTAGFVYVLFQSQGAICNIGKCTAGLNPLALGSGCVTGTDYSLAPETAAPSIIYRCMLVDAPFPPTNPPGNGFFCVNY